MDFLNPLGLDMPSQSKDAKVYEYDQYDEKEYSKQQIAPNQF